MGYNGEKASVNQFSDLYEYFEKNVASELKELYDENVLREKKINKNELRFTYVPNKLETITPLVSYDGGMTTLFQGQLTETCMLKIAGACPPDQKGIFSNDEIKEIFFHSFVGKLIHSDTDKEDELKNALREELKRLLEVNEFVTMLQVFGVKVEDFEEKFFGLVSRWKDKSTIKDTMRELLEWALVIDFLNSQKSKTHEDGKLPFLIIKDGNISSNPKAVTISISHKIQELLEGRNKEIPVPYIIGAVKNSRFTGESPLGKMISKFGKILPSHSFFKIPAAYEGLLDKDFASQPFSRYFLNIFGGDSVYEIQIPRVLSNNDVLLPQILDLIASQVTFSYGGSIITNSYAHKRASIAEVEGKMLEVQILKDMNKGKK
jgi:hypothetical protein